MARFGGLGSLAGSYASCWQLVALISVTAMPGCGGEADQKDPPFTEPPFMPGGAGSTTQQTGGGGTGGSSSNNSGADSGGANVGGSAAGNAGSSGDLAAQTIAAKNAVCPQIEKCYQLGPGLNGSCRAPGDGGVIISFGAGFTDPAAAETCFRQFLDDENLRIWLQCTIDANRQLTTCFQSCPASGTICTNQGNAAFTACGEPTNIDQLNACYQAETSTP